MVAIPFRVGWGGVGWGGVFNERIRKRKRGRGKPSQSLSGWGGVFNSNLTKYPLPSLKKVAIPFRVGWGFQQLRGFGFKKNPLLSQSLSGWGGVFNIPFPGSLMHA